MNLPKFHPQVIAIVDSLIKEGKAGKKPFGIDLAIWEQAIEERKEKGYS